MSQQHNTTTETRRAMSDRGGEMPLKMRRVWVAFCYTCRWESHPYDLRVDAESDGEQHELGALED